MPDTAASTETLNIRRVFRAPREVVFRCMIEPEHLTHFWGPTGMSTPLATITIDPRPGGVFETVMVSDADGSQYPMKAIFVEVVENEKLVWIETALQMTSTSTFTDLGDGTTEVHIEQSNVPAMFTTAEARAGMLSSLDRFQVYLSGLTPLPHRTY